MKSSRITLLAALTVLGAVTMGLAADDGATSPCNMTAWLSPPCQDLLDQPGSTQAVDDAHEEEEVTEAGANDILVQSSAEGDARESAVAEQSNDEDDDSESSMAEQSNVEEDAAQSDAGEQVSMENTTDASGTDLSLNDGRNVGETGTVLRFIIESNADDSDSSDQFDEDDDADSPYDADTNDGDAVATSAVEAHDSNDSVSPASDFSAAVHTLWRQVAQIDFNTLLGGRLSSWVSQHVMLAAGHSGP
jgi:hypothetical protein